MNQLLALQTQLREGLAILDIATTAPMQRLLLSYIVMLEKWNKTFNLTAIRKPQEMVTKHLLDSIAISPFLQGTQLLDVGTGAGLPGIPLAICYPERQFTLLDSHGKKCIFLRQVVAELNLSNIKVVQSRIEDFSLPQEFDTIMSRAMASVLILTQACYHLLKPGGRCVWMKSMHVDAELHNLAWPVRVESYTVPGLPVPQVVVIIEKEV